MEKKKNFFDKLIDDLSEGILKTTNEMPELGAKNLNGKNVYSGTQNGRWSNERRIRRKKRVEFRLLSVQGNSIFPSASKVWNFQEGVTLMKVMYLFHSWPNFFQ